MNKEFWILPKPKFMSIKEKDIGITLSSLWTIYVNKYRVRDNALLLSSKFNKHFNTFLNSIPIRDSTLGEKWGDNYFIAVITPESDYERKIKHNMNEMMKTHLDQFDDILNSCCYDLYPDQMKSNLPLNESYYVNISKGAIWVISTSPRGFYFGIQSVVQIVEHTIFQIKPSEKYIVIPKLTIVDFPRMKYRGVSVDLNSFTPSFSALTELVPFLAKYKINNLILLQHAGSPYSSEEDNEFRDLCEFHQIQLSKASDLDEMSDKKIKHVQYQADGRFILPDMKTTLETIAKKGFSQEEVIEGLLISTPRNWNCPLDLLLSFIPLKSDLLWNSMAPITEKWWIYVMEAAQLNLFETSVNDSSTNTLKKMTLSTYGNASERTNLVDTDISQIESLLADFKEMKENAYENIHLIDVLEWGFKSWILTLKILNLQDVLKSQDLDIKNSEETVIKIKMYKKAYQKLIPQVIKLLEFSNRVQKGACELYFQSHTSLLKKLAESWIPQILKN